jgi:hypothetical protein
MMHTFRRLGKRKSAGHKRNLNRLGQQMLTERGPHACFSGPQAIEDRYGTIVKVVERQFFCTRTPLTMTKANGDKVEICGSRTTRPAPSVAAVRNALEGQMSCSEWP